MRLSLSKKIIITIEVAVLSTAVILSLIFFFFLESNTKNEINMRLTSISYLKGDYISQYFNFSILDIETNINSREVHSEVVKLLKGDKNTNKEKVLLLLDNNMVNRSELIDFSILNNDGVIVASNNKQEEGKIKADESYFVDGKIRTTLKSFVYDLTFKKIILTIATPVKDTDGSVLGVFAVKINTENINYLMSNRLGLGETGETFLVNTSHVVITDLKKENGAALKKTIYLPQINSCLDKNSNHYLLNDYHGDKAFGYARWVPEIESCLISKVDYSEAMDPVLSLIPRLLLFIIVIFILALFSGYLISQSIVKPLQTLRDKALKVKDGDMDVEIEPELNDEVGDMAISFKEMLNKLKELYQNLEDKVKERTEKLEISERKLEGSLELYEKNNKMMINRELEMIKLKERIKELEEDKQNHGK